jgi:5-methylcytosine-specific restriction protein A
MAREKARMRGRRWVALRSTLLRKEPLCRFCRFQGRTSVAVEIDHVIPLEQGGSDAYDNLQPLCASCHLEKTARDRGYKAKGSTRDGLPLDPEHHWNKE